MRCRASSQRALSSARPSRSSACRNGCQCGPQLAVGVDHLVVRRRGEVGVAEGAGRRAVQRRQGRGHASYLIGRGSSPVAKSPVWEQHTAPGSILTRRSREPASRASASESVRDRRRWAEPISVGRRRRLAATRAADRLPQVERQRAFRAALLRRRDARAPACGRRGRTAPPPALRLVGVDRERLGSPAAGVRRRGTCSRRASGPSRYRRGRTPAARAREWSGAGTTAAARRDSGRRRRTRRWCRSDAAARAGRCR